MDKPIPAFYACYLLRSTLRHASLYVGSTPHPARRLRQHNGDTKGGAARTSRDSLRPWEMTCLVSGFPSKIAALQFEWAWQNTHLTRHVSPDSRYMTSKMVVRISPRTGFYRKRAGRPRMSLTDRLYNLHLLLGTSSFMRWPLRVTFYAEDVYRVWLKCAEHHLGSDLRSTLPVIMDTSGSRIAADGENDVVARVNPAILDIDVGHAGMKAHLEKSRETFDGRSHECHICREELPADGRMTLVCPKPKCSALTHPQCLGKKFLKSEKEKTALLPIAGKCPKCRTQLQWVDLVKEMTLRMRGSAAVDKLFKVRKPRAKKDANDVTVAAEDEMEEADEEADEPLPADDEWHRLEDSEEDDVNDDHGRGFVNRLSPSGMDREIMLTPPSRVIQDSDWDDAEVLT